VTSSTFLWSEDEYFALGETPGRVELIDGSLWASPAPTKRHQHIAFLLAMALDTAAEHAGLLVLRSVNLRLADGRIVQPDVVVADTDDVGLTVEAVEVKLVAEVVSPGDAVMDRLVRPQMYASAGIGWYLRVEQVHDSVELHLQKLAGDCYAPFWDAGTCQVLASGEPFAFDLDPASADAQ
jgi:Uma2 family endonuclease